MLRFVAHQYGTKAGFDFQMHMMLIFTDFHQPRHLLIANDTAIRYKGLTVILTL
jgi:hypothetical protein